MAVALLLNPESLMFMTLDSANVLPQWAILSIVCSLISVASVFISSCKLQALSRFLSGCVWGTLIMIYFAIGQTHAIFWTSIVLFTFDIIVVILKGQYVWIRESRS
jgi:hypothetical protein